MGGDTTFPFGGPQSQIRATIMSEPNTTKDDAESTGGTEHGWNFGTPSIVERASALLKGVFSGRFDHEIRTTIGARPKTRPMGSHEIVELDLYKIWFVLHYDETGEDRTTNLYIRKIGSTHTTPDHMATASICAMVLPLEYRQWRSVHTATGKSTDTDN